MQITSTVSKRQAHHRNPADSIRRIYVENSKISVFSFSFSEKYSKCLVQSDCLLFLVLQDSFAHIWFMYRLGTYRCWLFIPQLILLFFNTNLPWYNSGKAGFFVVVYFIYYFYFPSFTVLNSHSISLYYSWVSLFTLKFS